MLGIKKKDEEKPKAKTKDEAENEWLYHPNPNTLGDFITATEIQQRQMYAQTQWERKMAEAQYKADRHYQSIASIPPMLSPVGYAASETAQRLAKPDYEGAYNKKTPCKACGATGAKSEFHEHKDSGHDYSFIRRTCKNCGHIWTQIPLHLIPALMAERMTEGVEDAENV
jgi:hypothetical protein